MYTFSTSVHADKQHALSVKYAAMLLHLLHPLKQRNTVTEGREDAKRFHLTVASANSSGNQSCHQEHTAAETKILLHPVRSL